MNSKDEYNILLRRNQASLLLDDLAALVVSSSLSAEVRGLSDEVMEQAPGFTFGMDQAVSLEKMVERTLDQYQKKKMDDVALLDFIKEAKLILKNAESKKRGTAMAFMGKIFKGKEAKEREAQLELEQNYEKLCREICKYENEMKGHIDAASKETPGSPSYRAHERGYNAAKQKLSLLRQQEEKMAEVLDAATRVALIKEFNQNMAVAQGLAEIVVGNDEKREKEMATAEIRNERMENTIDKVRNFGESIFQRGEMQVSETSSEFGSKVAASQRQQSLIEDAGFKESQAAPALSDFDQMVRNEAANAGN